MEGKEGKGGRDVGLVGGLIGMDEWGLMGSERKCGNGMDCKELTSC